MATTSQAPPATGDASPRGMTITRRFTTEGVNPFDSVEWELRDARIGHGDKVAFEQLGVEFPKTWSQNATNIVSQKYFRGQLDSPERERSVKQMIGRVAGTIANWGRDRGYFATTEDADSFEAELIYILLHQMAAFNSPVWFNVGFEEAPQCSACFILSVEDNLDNILDWNTKEGRIFRGGSGSGVNLSNIRGSMELLSKGGTASGPVSFMRGADSWAGTIKSGGKTRRAAKMVVLDVDHPDIREFIWCKAKEEDKAQALRDAGFDMSIDGDGFKSIQFQNANNSVRVSDAFMQAVKDDAEWRTISRATGEPIGDPIPARVLMREIAEAAWRCADPGVQYDTVINDWHTCPVSGRINASNPCSEYMHVDNSACNLASLNVMKFRQPDGAFDVAAFEHTTEIVLLGQEIVVSPSSYPTEEIGINAEAFRQLGLGYTNLGAFLMSNGVAYDSDAGRGTSAAITALMTGRAYAQSAKIAAAIGPYEHYAANAEAHLAVMRMHREASYRIPTTIQGSGAFDGGEETIVSDGDLLSAAQRSWDEAVELGEQHGYRNAQATVLAPTGTISFLMDCDTTGIEPDFSLIKFKELVGGGQMTIVNGTVPLALETLGYTPEQIDAIVAYIGEEIPDGEPLDGVQMVKVRASIIGAPGLKAEHLPVFDVAVGERSISPMGHITMMGAVQPFISGAISKTVNMPQDSSVDDIEAAYMAAWRLGVKALAIYRDGSKTAQALRTDAQMGKGGKVDTESPEFKAAVLEEIDKLVGLAGNSGEVQLTAELREEIEKALRTPYREKLSRIRDSKTYSFNVAGTEGYMTVGMYDDGRAGEVFIKVSKQGSTLAGAFDFASIAVSIGLQYGVPLKTLVQKFINTQFEPRGMVIGDDDIKTATSMVDYLFRRLAIDYLSVEDRQELGIKTAYELTAELDGRGDSIVVIEHSPIGVDSGMLPCVQCGGMMQRTGACYTCSSCGNNTGCG
jgi:ribonucleoside-diphosphate reductase alpha chain